MIYGYARVSTKGQAKDGNSLEVQIELLKEYGVQRIFKDSFSGTKADRPNLKLLLNVLTQGDVLVVTKLDRIARSLKHGNDLVNDLIKRGIRVHIGNIGVLDDTPSSRLIRSIFFAFSEFERDMIVERTQEGKAVAKNNPNYREGRPRLYKSTQIAHALELLKTMSYKQVTSLTGISKSTLARAKKKASQSSSARQWEV